MMMKDLAHTGRLAGLVLLSVLLAGGCGRPPGAKGDLGRSGGGTVSSAATTAPPAGQTSQPPPTPLPPIPAPRTGTVFGEVPEIAILDPAPGTFVRGSSLLVHGKATVKNGDVQLLTVNGTPVAVDPATGDFDVNLQLESGVNAIAIRALSNGGRDRTVTRSVMAGEFQDEQDFVEGGLVLRLSNEALTVLRKPVQDAIANYNVDAAVAAANPVVKTVKRDPVFQKVIATCDMNLTKVDYGYPSVSVRATDTGLVTVITFPTFVANAEAWSVGPLPYYVSGGIQADKLSILTRGAVKVSPSGLFEVDLGSVSVSFTNFSWNMQLIPKVIENLVRSQVEQKIIGIMEKAIRDRVPPALAMGLQAACKPVQTTIGAATVTAEAYPMVIDTDGSGMTVRLDTQVSVPRAAATPQVPGSLRTRGAAPALKANLGFETAIADDLVNRVLHTLWAGGLLEQEITKQGFGTIYQTPIPMDSNLLTGFLPELQGKVANHADLVIRLVPLLPPAVTVTGHPDLLEIRMGGLRLEVLVDDGTNRTSAFTVAVDLRAGLSVLLSGNQVAFATTSVPVVHATLVDEPLADLDDRQVENLVQTMMMPLVPAATGTLRPMAVPALSGFQVSNLAARPDGPAGDYVTVSGTVR